MQASDIPSKFSIPFANAAGAGFVRPIPSNSQIGIQNGAASLTDGFPPQTFLPVGSGGTPPFGQDFNGILKQITQWARWQGAGGMATYDSAFSTAVGGYPRGATLASVTTGYFWLSLVDNNTNNPDTNPTGWARIAPGWIQLTANTNFFVSTTGNDTTGDGSAGNPWATMQHAWNFLQRNVNLNGFTATVSVAAGTYSSGLIAQGPIIGQSSSVAVVFAGDPVTPQNVVVNATNADAFLANQGALISVQGFTVSATGTGLFQGAGVQASAGASVNFQAMRFGNCVSGHVVASGLGVLVGQGSNTIAGNAPAFITASQGGFAQIISGTTACVGTPAFSVAFANCFAGILASGATFSGSATGKRYQGTQNAVFSTGGGGASYFPGSIAGTVDATSSYS